MRLLQDPVDKSRVGAPILSTILRSLVCTPLETLFVFPSFDLKKNFLYPCDILVGVQLRHPSLDLLYYNPAYLEMASTTARAVMLTIRLTVVVGVTMCTALLAPSNMGPTVMPSPPTIFNKL